MTMHILWSSILILIVIGVRALVRKKISQRLMYALWLVVLVKLCLPMSLFSVEMPFLASFANRGEEINETQPPEEFASPETGGATVNPDQSGNEGTYNPSTTLPDTSVNQGTSYDPSQGDNPTTDDPIINDPISDPVISDPIGGITDPSTPPQSDLSPEPVVIPDTPADTDVRKIDWAEVLRRVWIGGSVVLALWFVGTAVIFVIRLRKNREYYYKVGRLRVYRSEEIGSPCLAGFPPAIYITNEKMTREMLSMVLVHEYTHLRHLDPLWSLLRTAMVVIYWYNPLVWVAAFLSKWDAEFACDETVANKLNSDQRMRYANLLVDSIPVKRHFAIGFDSASIKERLLMLTKQYKKHTVAAVVAVIIAAVAVIFAFCGPKDTTEPPAADGTETGTPETDSPETDSPETDDPVAEPVKVISNEGGLDVFTVTIPAQINNHQAYSKCIRYDDRYVLCLTYDYHYDEASREGTRSNYHLYVIDTANGTVIHSQSLDCTDTPNDFTYTSDGRTVLVNMKYVNGDPTVMCAHEIEIYDGTVIVSDSEIDYYPHYESKVTSPNGKYTAYSVIDDTDYHGGIELRRIDGSVKRIYENNVILQNEGVSSDVYGCLAAYSPLGFLDEKHLVVLVSGYESAGTYEIYNVETGESVYVGRSEYKTDENGEEYMVSYTPEAVIDGWLYLTEHRNYNYETYGKIYGAWKVDLAGNMVKIAQVDGNNADVLSLSSELYWSMNGNVWHAYNADYNGWSLELEEYFESQNYRIAKTAYTADFVPLLEIEYPYFRGSHMEDMYIYRYGNVCTVITYAEGEPLPDTPKQENPVTVISNPKGYSVQNVYIPAGGDGSATGYTYSDGMKLYMTKDNVTDETGYVRAYTNIKLYLIDTDHARIVGECAIDGEYRLDDISYNTSGDGVVLRDVEYSYDEGYIVHGAFHILYSGGKLTATKIDADGYSMPEYANAYPQYDEPVYGNGEEGRYIAYSTTDDGWGRGGIDLKSPDGTVKRILTNLVLDDAGGNLSDVTYYTPVGFIDANVYDGAAMLVYNIGAYEGAGKGFGIYNVQTGEREEFLYMNYRAIDVWSNAIYFEEYKRTDEGYSESYRIWKRDRNGNMTLLWSTDPADGDAYHEGESFPSFNNGLWTFTSYPDLSVPDYLPHHSTYVINDVRHGDNFDPIVTVRYPEIDSYTSNFNVSTLGQVTVVLPVPEEMIPPDVTSVEFETVDELVTKFGNEIDGFARGAYERQEFLVAVDEFIDPEKYRDTMTEERYAALIGIGAENFSATYDKRSGKMYLTFTVTGKPVGTLKKGENTVEICESIYGIGVMCGDTSNNYANEARAAVSKYLGWMGNNGLPDASIASELVFTDYIASCLKDMGKDPTRAAVVDYAERCFGIVGYTPRDDQFDESGNHVQLGYGLGNVNFIITSDTVESGIHTVTVDFYRDSFYQEKYQTVNYRITKLQDGAWRFIEVVDVRDKAENSKITYSTTTADEFFDLIWNMKENGTIPSEPYDVKITGLSTPVVMHMAGDANLGSIEALGRIIPVADRNYPETVKSVCLYGNCGDKELFEYEGKLIFVDTFYDVGNTYIIYSDGYDVLRNNGSTSTNFYLNDKGELRYKTVHSGMGDMVVDGRLNWAIGYDDFFSEEGIVYFRDNRFSLMREEYHSMSDGYSLAAEFDAKYRGKTNGVIYETIEDVFEDNKKKLAEVVKPIYIPAEDGVLGMIDYLWTLSDRKELPMCPYDIYVTGLSVPFVIHMSGGQSLLTVEAYGVELDMTNPDYPTPLFDGSTTPRVFEVGDNIVFNLSGGMYYGGPNYIFSKNGCSLVKSGSQASVYLFLDENGDLKYRFSTHRTSDIQQTRLWEITSRDEFYYSIGDAEIVNGEAVLSAPYEVYTVSDSFEDLDKTFVEGKEWELYSDYETIEELFAANLKREMNNRASTFSPDNYVADVKIHTGKEVLFWHKIGFNIVYLYFTTIENGTKSFTVYYTDNYGISLEKLELDLPTDIPFDTVEPIWAGGGGGSGECEFVLKLTDGETVTYISYNNFHYTDKLMEFEYAGVMSADDVEAKLEYFKPNE